MRHIVHMMLGNESELLLKDVKKYVVKYNSEEEESKYFSALLYSEEKESNVISQAIIGESDKSKFISGLEDLFAVFLLEEQIIPKNSQGEYLRAYFTNLYNQRININNPGDSNELHLCIYVPLYDIKYWQITKEILLAIDQIEQKYNVDLFLLPYDLAFLLQNDRDLLAENMQKYIEVTESTLKEILDANTQKSSIRHLIMMQNCNNNGLSLDLNQDSFIRIIGEYALLSVKHYSRLFNINAQNKERPIHALGLSVLSFDKYYFVQYLLHKAYIHILDRENLLQTEVDVNKVSQRVHKLLSENVEIFTSFYNKYVEPRLERKIDQDTIITEVKPELDAEIARLTKDFQSYISDSQMSLPEKRATLAQLLGEDDDLLIGYMFNPKQLVIDDCAREVLDFFVRENNSIVELSKTVGESSKDENGDIVEVLEYASLSRASKESVELPGRVIDKLKKIKLEMRESSSYIRKKTEEYNEIFKYEEERENSKKRLTKEGFRFEDKIYLLQNDIEEIPCEEDYKPIENNLSKVDLREFFTPIKDQGRLGSCSSFTMVSIYEYILKKNKAQECNLSELFVYYYAHGREKDSNSEGTSLFNNILALQTEGICLEELYPYKDNIKMQEPSVEAKNDAQNRKVKKALNVQKDIKHIQSALSQGYPVAISLRIFESFTPVSGFIQRPTNDEISTNEYGNHAMVICGYSEEEKIFIVRNSWGTKFGDKGYCYIPYSYVMDFMNMACIITEVSIENIKVIGNDSKKTLSFDMTNLKIKSAILRNLIEEEKHILNLLDKDFQNYQYQFNNVFQLLGNNRNRLAICDGSLFRLEYEKNKLLKEKEAYELERKEELNAFDLKTKRYKFLLAILWFIVILVYVILLWPAELKPSEVFFSTWNYVGSVVIFVLTICAVFWFIRRKIERKDLDLDYQSKITQKLKQINKNMQMAEVIKLKSHLAGMIIDSLSKLFRNLHSKYSSMRSYIGNLCVWREEESKESCMSDVVKEPFLSLLSNKCLDKFFNTCKDDITKNIKLYEMFNNSYKIDDSEIIKFKNSLKETLIKELFSKIADFSIYKHSTKEVSYLYTNDTVENISSLLQLLDKKSRYFVRITSTLDTEGEKEALVKLLFADLHQQNATNNMDKLCNDNFQSKPQCVSDSSKYKISLVQMVGLKPEELAVFKHRHKK